MDSIERRIARTINGKDITAVAIEAPSEVKARRRPKVSKSHPPSGPRMPKVSNNR